MKEIIKMLRSIGVKNITVKSLEEISFRYGIKKYVLKIQEFKITITDKKITFNFSRNRDAVDLIKDFLSM